MTDLLTIAVPGAGLQLDRRLGTLTSLWFETDGRRVAPLHCAPWLDEAAVQADEGLAPVERRLTGDFFCAPFGGSGDGVPIHGWAANSPWEVDEITQNRQQAVARLTLRRSVQGARITKTLRLTAHDPLVYQTHIITGGEDGLTVAHHPMFHMVGAGWLSFSAKALAMTPDVPLEPGRNWLKYPAQSLDLSNFPGKDGPVDLHSYPKRPAAGVAGHEDFISLIEAKGAKLGWTVLIREAEDDLVLILKDPRVLPLTMMWYSNGGRDRSPWNRRHIGVLGIEDGCAAGAAGLLAARGDNAFTAQGIATTLPLSEGQTHTINHVIGAVPRPNGWVRVTDVRQDGASLRLTEAGGETIILPFAAGFFPR